MIRRGNPDITLCPTMAAFAYLFERFPSFTQTFCYREVSEVLRKGIEIEVFSIRYPEDLPADCPDATARRVTYLPTEEALRVELRQMETDGNLPKPVLSYIKRHGKKDLQRVAEALWLGPRLRRKGIGHVHVHFAGIAARTAYWLKRLYGICYSFTAHANDVFCETRYPISQADLFREASLVVTVSDFSCKGLREAHPRWAAKILRVYNGIDMEQFRRTSFPSGSPHIVSVGRCIEKKGFADLIDACAILRDRGVDFRCSIIGSGPLEEELRARIASRELVREVRMTGPKPQEELRDLLSQAHLFVLACAPEQDGGMDNLPTVIAEAMSCGLPVVSTRIAGVPEMVEEASTGLLTDPCDPASFAAAMERLLENPVELREFGARGFDRVAKRFATGVTTDHLLQSLSRCRRVKLDNGRAAERPFFLKVREKIAELLWPDSLAAAPRWE